ncbi:butyrophilin subfamily 1 member A1-like [Columba livia]|uniref:Butyrophilin subfamily 1 member A1-like n=1 Tax=Columba livia TaxID=8932 RepID=A0A2I0LKP2_COLLI|nr:butyrophilin subfamily 1 member A1-like [Columba livia]
MLEYVGRTELWKDGLAKGSVNLKIFDVQLPDRGNYTCFVVNGSDYDEAVVELKVTVSKSIPCQAEGQPGHPVPMGSLGVCVPAVSGSVPLIALERYQDGGIRVSCRSAGWYPRPQVLWRDPHGQHLPSLSESVTQDQSSLFVVESSIILTRGTKQNVSCWVRHVLDGQERGSEFYISGEGGRGYHPIIAAHGAALGT